MLMGGIIMKRNGLIALVSVVLLLVASLPIPLALATDDETGGGVASGDSAYQWFDIVYDRDVEKSDEVFKTNIETTKETEPQTYGKGSYSNSSALNNKALVFSDLDFGSKGLKEIQVRFTSQKGSTEVGLALGEVFEIWIDGANEKTGTHIGNFYGKTTGGWNDKWTNMKAFLFDGINVTGKHDVYIVFKQADRGRVSAISFTEKDGTETEPQVRSAYDKTFNPADDSNFYCLAYVANGKCLTTKSGNGVGTFFYFHKIDFGKDGLGGIVLNAASNDPVGGKVLLDVRVDSVNGRSIGNITAATTDGWAENNARNFDAADVAKVTGVHDVYFVVQNALNVNLYGVSFKKADPNDTTKDAYDRWYNAVEDSDSSKNGADFKKSENIEELGADGSFGKKNFKKNIGKDQSFVISDVEFGKEAANMLGGIEICYASMSMGNNKENYSEGISIEIWIDADSKDAGGKQIGTFYGRDTGGWYNWKIIPAVLTTKAYGKHDVYFKYVSDKVGNVCAVRFVPNTSVEKATVSAYSGKFAAVNADINAGLGFTTEGNDTYLLGAGFKGAYFVFEKLDFGSDEKGEILDSITIKQASDSSAISETQPYIDVHVDSLDGDVVARIMAKNTGDPLKWEEVTAKTIKKINGVHTLYFVYNYAADVNILDISFKVGQKTAEKTTFGYWFNVVDDADQELTSSKLKSAVGEVGDGGLYGTKGYKGSEDIIGSSFVISGLNFGNEGNPGLGTILVHYTSIDEKVNSKTGFAMGEELEIWLDSDSENSGGCKIGSIYGYTNQKGEFLTVKAAVSEKGIVGEHKVYFKYLKGDLNVNAVQFVERSTEVRSAYQTFILPDALDYNNGLGYNYVGANSKDNALRGNVTNGVGGQILRIDNLDFGTEESGKNLGEIVFNASTVNSTKTTTYISVFIDAPSKNDGGTLIARFIPSSTGSWSNYTDMSAKVLRSVYGVHDVYFVYTTNYLYDLNIHSITFSTESSEDGVKLSDYDIDVKSKFDGYNSIVNRPTTGSDEDYAYDYSVYLMEVVDDKTGKSTFYAYSGGRWKSDRGDGDHVLLYASETGEGYTWKMVGNGPVVWQGQEEGIKNQWYSYNVIEPEVLKVNGTWYMYTQVEIEGGTPIDDAAKTPSKKNVWADRIMLLTSSDGVKWTRKTDRGVIVNIPAEQANVIQFHHEEVMYVPFDPDGKCFWMYVCISENGTSKGYFRIRSSKPDTFDYETRESTGGMAQLGNQVGYLTGGSLEHPIYVRTTHVAANGRRVPALQYSLDGLTWQTMSLLKGSEDMEYNKNCYFVGMSTINGTGQIKYIGKDANGNDQWKIYYACTTANDPQAKTPAEGYGIWKSEIGGGTAIITISKAEEIKYYEYELRGIGTECKDNIISNLLPVQMTVDEETDFDEYKDLVYNWSVDDESIATIDKNGVLTPKKQGVVQVTLRVDGRKATCLVMIRSSSILITSGSDTVLKGRNEQLGLKVKLNGYSDEYDLTLDPSNVSWSVSNNALARIDSNGLLQGIGNGTITVVAVYKHPITNATVTASKSFRVGNGYIVIEMLNSDMITTVSAEMTPKLVATAYSIGSLDVVWSGDEKKVKFNDLTSVDTPENQSIVKLTFLDSGKITIRASLKDYPDVYTDFVFNVVPYKGDLEMALYDAASYNMDDYSALRWNNLQLAIRYAKYIYDKKDATQAEINEAIALLERVIGELILDDSVSTEPIPTVPADYTGGSDFGSGGSKDPHTGVQFPTIVVVIFTISLAVIAIVLKAKKFLLAL